MKSNYDIKRALRLASEKHWNTIDNHYDDTNDYEAGWTDALLYVAKELDLEI